MFQRNPKARKPRLRRSLCATALAFSMLAYVPAGHSNDGSDGEVRHIKTASPIKHAIIIVGENRSFDHVYATYVPRNRGESVRNLLSEGIINADGTPGKNFATAHQFQVTAPPNNGKYFITPPTLTRFFTTLCHHRTLLVRRQSPRSLSFCRSPVAIRAYRRTISSFSARGALD